MGFADWLSGSGDGTTPQRAVDGYLAFVERLEAPIIWLATLFVAVATGIVILQILLRNTVGTAPTGINTLATWLAIWAGFLLIGVLIWQDDHLKIELVYGRLSHRLRRLLRTVQLGLYVLFGLLILFWGYVYTVTSGPNSTAIQLGLQKTWLYASIPIGGLLMSLFSLGKLLEVQRDPGALEITYEAMDRSRTDE